MGLHVQYSLHLSEKNLATYGQIFIWAFMYSIHYTYHRRIQRLMVKNLYWPSRRVFIILITEEFSDLWPKIYIGLHVQYSLYLSQKNSATYGQNFILAFTYSIHYTCHRRIQRLMIKNLYWPSCIVFIILVTEEFSDLWSKIYIGLHVQYSLYLSEKNSATYGQKRILAFTYSIHYTCKSLIKLEFSRRSFKKMHKFQIL